MASKRQRGEGSQSRAVFDHAKFVSKEASDRFHNILMKKTFVLERGLRPDPQLDGDMALMIAERNWFDLVRQPRAAVIPIVKEFYANAKERDGYVVQVRGRPVAFDSYTINALFNIEDIGETNRYEDVLPELDGIIRWLCRPGTTWTVRIDSGEKVSFPHSALSKYGKAWYAFICANLMPTRHQNDVTKDRAKLLYGIVRQFHLSNNETRILDVDIGMTIQQSILRFVQGGTSGGIPHGSLITELCRQAGVQWNASEPLQQPMAAIDHLTIDKYRAWDGAISHPRGQGFIMPTPSSPPQPPPQSPPPIVPNPTPPPATPSSWQRRIERQNWCIAQRQAEMHNYNVGAFQALSAAFAQFNTTVPPIQMPVPPVLPPYPPSYSDDEDN